MAAKLGVDPSRVRKLIRLYSDGPHDPLQWLQPLHHIAWRKGGPRFILFNCASGEDRRLSARAQEDPSSSRQQSIRHSLEPTKILEQPFYSSDPVDRIFPTSLAPCHLVMAHDVDCVKHAGLVDLDFQDL